MRIGWRAKAMTQLGLSYVPGGNALNYRFQRSITRSLPPPDQVLRENIETAQGHLAAAAEHLDDPGHAVFYEFGAGWGLGVAFVLSALGVGHQILVDVRPLTRDELLADAVARLPTLGQALGVELDLPPWPTGTTDVVSALQGYGIEYRAPCDARATGLPSGSVDVVTSTSTFEHIPDRDIVPILDECRRLLRPGGVVSAWIDYKDHYAAFDDRLSPYNFLQFDERTWRWYSPPFQYQNRLRHPEYVARFEQAGFAFDRVEVVSPSADDLATLDRLDLDRRFAGFSPVELGIRDGRFLARPAQA